MWRNAGLISYCLHPTHLIVPKLLWGLQVASTVESHSAQSSKSNQQSQIHFILEVRFDFYLKNEGFELGSRVNLKLVSPQIEPNGNDGRYKLAPSSKTALSIIILRLRLTVRREALVTVNNITDASHSIAVALRCNMTYPLVATVAVEILHTTNHNCWTLYDIQLDF